MFLYICESNLNIVLDFIFEYNCVFLREFNLIYKYSFLSMMIPQIRIEDYNYDLPDERIAKYPLSSRDLSKLLIYKDQKPEESTFKSISEVLPEGSMMVFNDTKVVPARLHFQGSTGAHIEIFCLEPVEPE